jgi:hypothetical protein
MFLKGAFRFKLMPVSAVQGFQAVATLAAEAKQMEEKEKASSGRDRRT